MMNTEAFRTLFIVTAIVVCTGVAGIFAVNISRIVKDKRSPVLTVGARVVSKRCERTSHRIPNAGDPTGAHGYTDFSGQRYFVAFLTDDGSRLELDTDGDTYASLSETDRGTLTYQGTRFLGFEPEAQE